MPLVKNKKNIRFIWFVSIVFSSSNIFAQTNKQTDSLLVSVNKKLEVIDKKLSGGESINKETDKGLDLKKENKELKKQIEDLKKQINWQTSQISVDKKRTDYINALLKVENSKLDQELKKQKNALKEKEKDNQNFYDKEKVALEKEIASILNQGCNLPQNLLISLQERSWELKNKPSNFNSLNDYVGAHKKINDVFLLLNNLYEGVKVKEAIAIVEKINLDAITFSGLMANKKELGYLLSKYCERTNELSKIIEDAKVKSDETKRQEWLEGFKFKTKGIPYLVTQLEKAIKDRNYKLEKVNCQ